MSISNELVIKSTPESLDIALLKDGSLFELHRGDRKEKDFAVGDIFLGRIKKIMPGLNAAFVDIGSGKDAFLHYHDLGQYVRVVQRFVKNTQAGKHHKPNVPSFSEEEIIDKNGKISDVLNEGDTLVVQVTKEPISTKGPRISSELSFAGRYLVLMPFSDKISISQKIEDKKERKRLLRLVNSIKPKNFGVIVRTVATDKMVADLDKDLHQLAENWNRFFEALKTAKPGTKILGEIDHTSALLRDILNDSFQGIYLDDEKLYADINDYLGAVDPDKQKIVKKIPVHPGGIFEKFGVNRQIKTSFGKSVPMKRGAYLIIEHTEALHVIDVNSGNRSNKEASQEENALAVNLIAAKEIARQLRLRDMGGIIVVDFIDMNSSDHRKMLFDQFKEFMSDDRAKHKILPPSRFGLVQITRQRVRPELEIVTSEKCPSCKGTGKIDASIQIEQEVTDYLEGQLSAMKEKKCTLWVHPFIAAYLTKGGWFSIRRKMMRKYKRSIIVREKSAFHLKQFELVKGK